jgi:uncharacterized protein with NAD-binding domain and iron-sulfur cluster
MPIRAAIIGGGCASLAAAFELTRPELQERYEVTVYQLGWRLGGKGASGRGVANRIEEHGLHLWMGWYENAFRLMRECYAELKRDPQTCPFADWRDAFAPVPVAGLMDMSADGEWAPWQATLPPAAGLPGDPANAGQRWSVADYMSRAVELIRALLQNVLAAEGRGRAAGAAGAMHEDEPGRQPAGGFEDIGRLMRYGEIASLTGLLQAISLLQSAVGSIALYPENVVVRFLDAIASGARSLLETRLEQDAGVRRAWQVVDLTLATMRGVIRSRLITDPRGFDAIDEYDCREWLQLNGAAPSSLDSGWLRALYDFGFSYEDGDPGRPRIAAGQGLRAMVRAFFTYRGAFFWRMQAGMGDVVFAPLYEVLRRRGVRFEFFHRLENVRLADPTHLRAGESPYVEALEFDVQAEVIGGAEYRPLVDVGGLPCWPAAPDYGQLAGGERLRREGCDFESHWDRRRARAKTLHVARDFDFVVLGVGIGAIPHVCGEIVARDPRWRAMVDHVKTVATQAMQIWMNVDMEDLGWSDGQTVLSGFTEPFDTWADMRHLISRESWPATPRSLAYFCSVLADTPADRSRSDHPARQSERVRRNAIRFLNRDVAHLWPRAVRDGQFRWEVLADPSGAGAAGDGASRFASQYWTANVNPSDRYALSLPGSSAYRISPLDETYDNLTIAGDWTSCGFNAGCVEAAVISGKLAAHAICKSPPLDEIVGFDHP